MPADGIYMVKSGEFELAKEINVKKKANKYLEKNRKSNISLGEKLSMQKTSSIMQDGSLTRIRVANVGFGETLGMEEVLASQVTPSNPEGKIAPRKNTVTCVTRDASVMFISLDDFQERVAD